MSFWTILLAIYVSKSRNLQYWSPHPCTWVPKDKYCETPKRSPELIGIGIVSRNDTMTEIKATKITTILYSKKCPVCVPILLHQCPITIATTITTQPPSPHSTTITTKPTLFLDSLTPGVKWWRSTGRGCSARGRGCSARGRGCSARGRTCSTRGGGWSARWGGGSARGRYVQTEVGCSSRVWACSARGRVP